MCGELVGHPFDLTKTRLQTAAPGSYTGAIDVVKKTLARDGVKGYVRRSTPDSYMVRERMMMLTTVSVLWYLCVGVGGSRMYRGMGPPLIGVTPIFAISFWVSVPTPFPFLTPHSISGNLEIEPQLELELELILDLVVESDRVTIWVNGSSTR